VRKVSFGVGVERTFPVHSPTIAKLEVATFGDVRRAKLYYLRDRAGKSAKIKERRQPPGRDSAPPAGLPLSEEELEQYEAEIELALVQEYRAVLPCSPTWWRPSGASTWPTRSPCHVRSDTQPACVELELTDAWVWDMYRPARFVPSVRVVTFRDVNIERLPEKEL
jgi:hypothetical protein